MSVRRGSVVEEAEEMIEVVLMVLEDLVGEMPRPLYLNQREREPWA